MAVTTAQNSPAVSNAAATKGPSVVNIVAVVACSFEQDPKSTKNTLGAPGKSSSRDKVPGFRAGAFAATVLSANIILPPF